MRKAYLAGGCFWCTETYFQRLKGVTSVVSGYSGGHIKNPTYKEICSGLTGHAELIEVSYDESQISFEDLMAVFFYTHDPTTLNRQGNDVGTQYRSAIFYIDERQKEIAQNYIKEEAPKIWQNPIVTEVTPLDIFYPAEAYHQDYYNINPNQGYCRIVIAPKLEKFSTKFNHLLA